MTKRVAAATLLAALACAVPPTIAARQTPARDVSLPPTVGTASISGVVVTDEATPRPVRRAIVRLTGPDLRPARGAITDDDGRFTIEGLPAGRVTLTVSRTSFITSAYGAKRPARPGTSIALADGERKTDLVVRLWRGAVVAGVVRDEAGDPVPGVPVTAKRIGRAGADEMLTLSNNGATTNDRGEYRLFGLAPGTYIVSVTPGSGSFQTFALDESQVDEIFSRLRRRTSALGGAPAGAGLGGTAGSPATTAGLPADARPFDYAPVYYPGTSDRAQAAALTLVPGQEAAGLDIPLIRVPTAIVDGLVTRSDGQPITGAQAQLLPTGLPFVDQMQTGVAIDTTVGADGVFRFNAVPPGEYTLMVRTAAQPATRTQVGVVTPFPEGAQLWAMTTIGVAGADVTGLAMALRPPLTLSGSVRFEGGTAPAESVLTRLSIQLYPPGLAQLRGGVPIRSIGFVRPATPSADGTFAMPNVVPGEYTFGVGGPALGDGTWWPASAMLEGRDLLDGLVTITPDMTLSGVEITLTDRHTELSGLLRTASGAPATDVFIIAAAADRRDWQPGGRRIQAVRPGIDGRYTIKDLPPGEYLLAAVADVDENEWQDPAFLEQLVPASVRVTIAPGGTTTQDLQLGGG